jgi:putative ABC transport system permease protein
MNSFAFAVRSLMRDLRAGELTVLLVAIIVAVSAMTAVGFFTDRVGRAVKSQASAVLAADLVVRSASPIDSVWLAEARSRGLKVAESIAFPTMVLKTDAEESALAFIRAVSDAYPLKGEVLVSTEMFDEPVSADSVPESGTTWVEPGLLGRLDLAVGDKLTLGVGELQITRVLEYQPNQGFGGFSGMAPGMMVNLADLADIDVIKPGSRVTYRHLYAGDPEQIADFRRELTERLGTGAQIRGLEDAGEQITAAIDRAQRFLNLASLVTVILAAVATAMASRRYALRHLDTIALVKSVGATQGFIQNSTLAQLLMMILGTSLIGTGLGFVAQSVLVGLASEVLRLDLPPTSLYAGSLGMITAATIAIGFTLPHLLQLRTTSPLRVLRHDLPPPPLRAGFTYGVALAALLGMIYYIVRDLSLVGFIASGMGVVAAVAVAAGWLLIRILTQFRGAAGVAWRYGLASIARRGRESIVQIVAFALGLMVLLLLTLVRNDLLGEWKRTLPADAPNYFMINIDPALWPDMEAFFENEVGVVPDYLPLIRGRITRVKGIPAESLSFEESDGPNILRQEVNLTWRAELPETNEIKKGQWWGADYDGSIQISLESGVASRLGVSVGDQMTIDVAGEEFEAAITSLRFVEWDSMQPNFYFMLSPGESELLPQTYIASIYVPREKRKSLSRLVRSFPGVTVLDLEVIMGQVRMVINRASMSVQYVFLFTLLAGVIVLLAAIQVTRDERRFESALLRTLGAQRRQILQGVAVEFTALGALAGLLASFGATGIGYVLADQVFKLDYTINPLHWIVGLVAGSLIVGVTGTLATRKAVAEPPVTVLRQG